MNQTRTINTISEYECISNLKNMYNENNSSNSDVRINTEVTEEDLQTAVSKLENRNAWNGRLGRDKP